jgi:hypothetical protein
MAARPPGSKHLDVLKERRDWLLGALAADTDPARNSYRQDEVTALDWAIDALEGSLSFPPEANEMRLVWQERRRLLNNLDAQFRKFCDFLDWEAQRLAEGNPGPEGLVTPAGEPGGRDPGGEVPLSGPSSSECRR